MALLLEAFDEAPLAEVAAPAGPTADWMMGHAAGLAEGAERALAEAEARQEGLSRELVQAFEDMAFAYAEARGAVMASLRPLLGAVLERLLPEAAALSLVPRLVERIVEAARQDSAQAVLLHVHPSREAQVRACLPRGAGPAAVLGDPALGPHGARIAHRGRETELDLDGCLGEIAGTLSALLDDSDRKARHG